MFVVFFLLNISLSLPVAVMLMIIFLVPLPSSDAKPHGTGKIVKSTLEECQEAYATWLDMALSFSSIFMIIL